MAAYKIPTKKKTEELAADGRAGHLSPQERHDRLDPPRKRKSQNQGPAKRILRKHGYPPDLQDEATKLVLQQAEFLYAEWAA
jgi:hypothetical protein